MFSEFISSIGSRKASHVAGVLLGLLLGALGFANGVTSCFAGVTETPRQSFFFLIGILAMLSLLPLTLAAITRPRFAARAIAVAWVSFIIAFYGSIPWENLKAGGIPGIAYSAVWFFALPWTVVALLLYASSAEAPPRPAPVGPQVSGPPAVAIYGAPGRGGAADRRGHALEPSSRKRLAKWAAMFLGAAVGASRFCWAWHSALDAPAGLHLIAFGFTAPYLAAIPLAVLGLRKPRWAAYGFAAAFLVLLASPLRAAQRPSDVVGSLLFPGVLALPFALVAALFFYASHAGAAEAG